MGAATCDAVAAASDLVLVAAVDPTQAGQIISGDSAAPARGEGSSGGLVVSADVSGLEATGIDVAVDFTVASAARENLRWCGENGVHAVCGTTGLEDADIEELSELFGSGRPANAVIAPNFSIGAVLMMRCAELCAPHFESAEIVELHHDRKRDAPSGTAMATAGRMAEARASSGSPPLPEDPTERFTVTGARGAVTEGGLHVHSVRLPGLVAHQEVILGSAGETLTIRHDSTDRVSFMPGVLLAIRRVEVADGLTVGLGALLDL
jgi:4-hydroxy-tetrahydrodipicolinate reductase